jgi:hypothetical protein
LKENYVGNKRIRTALEVINQAISENKLGERLLYGFAVAFATIGLFVIVWAAINRSNIVSVVGLLTSALFWPAMSSVRRTRKENIAIRLLETPLSRADTAKDAAEMLQQLFQEIFGDKRQDGEQPPRKVMSAAKPDSPSRRVAER